MELPIIPTPPLKPTKATGTQILGHAYERKIARWLQPQCESLGWHFYNHPWLTYKSSYCQPDFLLVAPSECVIIVEAKLTECDCAAQFAKYKSALRGFPTISLQIARRVTSRPTVDCLENTIDNGLMLVWL